MLDHYLDPNHADYVGEDLANNWIVIRYHSNAIGWGDPMYHGIGAPDFASNCVEDPVCYRFGGSDSNDPTYSPNYLPTLYMDGEISTSIDAYKADANSIRSEETSIYMSFEGTTFDTLTAYIKLAVTSDSDISGEDLRLFVAMTMDSISFNGSNGEKEHHGVFLGWANSYFGGDTLVISKDDTIKNSYEWTLREDYPKNSYFPKNDSEMSQITWDKKNMSVIAFVQKKSTNEILQATKLDRKNAPTADIQYDQLQPSGFSLDQNYPNPFNSGTTISYSLSEKSQVSIAIYSLLGKPIRTLVKGDNKHSGFHSISWDGEDNNGDIVSGGVYFYRINTEKFTAVRKMLLLK